ncbi:MAG: hypothetical protein AMJ61_09035 [Desulfobacterales bacterium SG8_35_2]|jgi:glycosyltransferase involved in cell wall biosynthesis|nr:MAG: hypothetical protein AMJ61_09035 [Desulfobacterales bacterium SG8_35_2]
MGNFPHICFVAPEAYPELTGDTSLKMVGGAQVQQCIIARALAKRGYKVSMICLDFGQPDDLIVDGIRVIKAFKQNAGIPVIRFLYPRMTTYWKSMKIANADIYYQRTSSFLTGLVSFFCRQTGKKMIFSVANDNDLIPGQQYIKYKRDKLIFEWGLNHADAVIVQSKRQKELSKQNYNIDSTFIRSCCEAASNKTGVDKQVDVLWVSTIRTFKKPEIFIELAQRMPEFRFRMIGGPENNNGDPFYGKIKEKADQLPNLEFIGFVPYAEIDKHFDAARLFVNTSEFEGFPNTFLQSWIRGIPTLSFFDPEAVLEGQQVNLVVKTIDELVLNIKELLGSSQKYVTLGKICKRYTEQFHSPEKIINEYSKIFAKLIR